MKSSKEIRKAWIDYFVSKGHLFIESKSLIPDNDPSLLWINSGVATLKDYFSGKKNPPSKRLTNSQKAIRTNDIENVGVTARHHTFFEMLGNFSIGDYFKNEAIEFANDVLTKVFKFDKSKIFITYYEEDIEVKNKWLSLGYDSDHLIAGNKKLNFWDVGSGPCGPSTEIFYDRGEKFNKKGKELIEKDIENDRFIEIWNIVFSQYNNLGNGKYVELAQKNIDTGAGLERIVSIIQNGPTNFDTDLFLPIINEVEKLCKYKYDIDNYFKNNKEQNIINKHFKIIADHMRAITNAISDGEKPSNTQRGYIIRRLIRRAYYSGKKLEIKNKEFLYLLVNSVVNTLIYDVDVEKVSKIIKIEEKSFSSTIEQGKQILEEEMKKISSTKIFNVNVAFKLYETYGFPIEMTKDILEENGFTLDFDKLSKLKEEHSKISKSKKNIVAFSKQINSLNKIKSSISKFDGYEHIKILNSKILFLLDDENEKNETDENEISYLIIDKTPFYATSGGQQCDKGYFLQNNNKIEVLDVFKDKYNNNIHVVKGKINKNESIDCYVDWETRKGLMRNHSATHLLFAALRNIYGNQIEQLGSNNNQERLTFDFPLDHKMKNEEIKTLEQKVNEYISLEIKRNYIETTIENAKKINAIMTKEEQEYFDSNNVRVVEFKGITNDLCGGTHAINTKDLEKFKIINVESKGTGIFRIRAITSKKIVNDYLENEIKKYDEILNSLIAKYTKIFETKKTKRELIKRKNLNDDEKLENKLDYIKSDIEKFTNEIKILSKEKNVINNNINFKEIFIDNVNILIAQNLDKNTIKDICINEREKNIEKIVIGISKYENKKSLIVVTSKKINVLDFINKYFNNINLKGGGNNLIWQGVSDFEISENDILKK